MKRLFSRLWVWAGSVFMTAILAVRVVLELIGYATITDDARQAHGLIRVFADMALALPWWAIWWPLFISYICACGIALDFSFDLFKRPKRTRGKAGKHLDRISSYYKAMSPHRSNRYGGFLVSGKLAALAETKMLWEYLHNEGFLIEDLPIDEEILENMDDFYTGFVQVLKKVSAYLERGEIQQAKRVLF